MFSLLWAFALVLLHNTSIITARSTQPKPLKSIAHPSTHSLQILPRTPQSYSPNTPWKRSHPSLTAPDLRHSDSLRLIVNAFNESFHLHLRPNDHLIHSAARINYYTTGPDGSSRLSRTEPLLRESVKAYWGEVVVPHASDARLREDAAGVVFRPQNADDLGWARIIVHDQGDELAGIPPKYEGAFSINGDVHHIILKDNYQRNKHPLDPIISSPLDDLDTKMVIWRDSDASDLAHDSASSSQQQSSCAHDSLPHNSDPLVNPFLQAPPEPASWLDAFSIPLLSNSSHSKRDDVAGSGTMGANFVNTIGQTAGCPSSAKVLYMGVAADCKYTEQYGSVKAATEQILSNWNTASALYKSTFNISLGIVEVQIQDADCPSTTDQDIPWNVDCSSVTLNQRLSLFSEWRGRKGDDSIGLWHLMSGCPTGTEVGIAWLATICQTSSSGTDPSVVSGTGVSTGGRVEWQVVAHEIGHNFGAIHDCADGCSMSDSCCPRSTTTCNANAGFLMSPVAAQGETEFSPCTIGNICSVMQPNSAGGHTDTSCLVDPDLARQTISLQMCGNGIVEKGEDCDPGTNSTSQCCDAKTCKFINNAVCDPDSSPCCTEQCGFAPSTQVCRAARDQSCDTAEMCTGTSAKCPEDVRQPNGHDCGNGLKCASGVCTSNDKQCQLLGASLNLQKACPSRGDQSCLVSCQDPDNANQCKILQSSLIDGSPCGYGGTCDSGSCKAGSALDTAKAWYTQNLQISIPVTIAVGIVVLLLLWAFVKTFLRCMRGRRSGYNAPTTPGGLRPLSMSQQRGIRIPSTTYVPPVGAPPPPTHPARLSRTSRNSRGNWVDPMAYNGSGR